MLLFQKNEESKADRTALCEKEQMWAAGPDSV